ncbi:PilZ domain-containing protein [Alloalcanivorax gelatiniphagus]|uniref:PilZ domain-containing protein n=1 Tax=Alloalcanivorax gelatiniphagus TaxID=1194167 RepID=A0ABY2XM99_9GAMM|nr:PilZ domain-containing protein [Alloalcanivorax gelatiniphagus]TMW13413.1 PilZ domain-containing protein [Alloalcanivorax gelatiniphagus]|tara:strand:- start:4249 stop:4599 length:351 start_codon:yes stop_codon:yes gene_type:complete
MGASDEHRQHPRHDAPGGVTLILRPERGDDQEPLELLCRDLSRTGLGVRFPHSIPPDTDVELWVHLPEPGAGTLHLFGTVAWCAAPLGQWRAGIALNLERGDGAGWEARFAPGVAS